MLEKPEYANVQVLVYNMHHLRSLYVAYTYVHLGLEYDAAGFVPSPHLQHCMSGAPM